MARIWFSVDGYGLVPAEIPDSMLDAMRDREGVEIRLEIWRRDFALHGTTVVKIRTKREPQ